MPIWSMAIKSDIAPALFYYMTVIQGPFNKRIESVK
jgi:hypothetical protein